MKSTDWIALGLIGVLIYIASKMNQLQPSTVVAPGAPGPSGTLLTLPPGLPSGQAAINAALGYDASGNPINNGGADVTSVLQSTQIGIGYVDLAPGLAPSVTFDDGLVSDSSDQGDFGLAPLVSYQTVPYLS